jgi:uncharacterized protein (DUF433 family)
MEPPEFKTHIEITPDVCGGKPRIAHSRIRVQDVVIWHDHWGLSPEEIVAEFPSLSVAEVHAALSYYDDHQAEIHALMLEEEEFASRMAAKSPSILDRKLGDLKDRVE